MVLAQDLLPRLYRHTVLKELESVIENDHCKILWDFPTNTDRAIQHHRPDVMVIYKGGRECLITDFPFPRVKKCNHEGIRETSETLKCKRCCGTDVCRSARNSIH